MSEQFIKFDPIKTRVDSMQWQFDRGEWCKLSAANPEHAWRIVVCDDGTFDISESDSELTDRKTVFATLAAAKAFCESSDNAAIVFDECEFCENPATRTEHFDRAVRVCNQCSAEA